MREPSVLQHSTGPRVRGREWTSRYTYVDKTYVDQGTRVSVELEEASVHAAGVQDRRRHGAGTLPVPVPVPVPVPAPDRRCEV